MVSEWGKLQFCWEGIKCCDSVDSVLFLAPADIRLKVSSISKVAGAFAAPA